MAINVELLKNKALNQAESFNKLVKFLKKTKPKGLDVITQSLHDKAFEAINCLDCANCCKSISPIVTHTDIARLAKHLGVKPSELTEKYFEIDTDNDYVFKTQPCPFLADDNYCIVYTARPKACREYPHTNRRRFYQLLTLSLKNTEVCPAVFHVFKGLREYYNT